MVVYLDGFILLNFLVDWLLLLGVNRLAGYPPGAKRAAAGAALGGGYAGMCLVPGFAFLASRLWRGVSLAVMSAAAFGLDRSAWRRGVLFVLLSMAMGGLAVCFGTGRFPGLVLGAAALALLCRMGLWGRLGRRLVQVELALGEKRIRLTALCDTGNTLRDPMTGAPVLVAGPQAARALLGLGREDLLDPMGSFRPGMRLIPCATVGGQGLLLAVRCDEVRIGGEMAGKWVAFAPDRFPGGEYQALTGGQYG